MKKGKKGEKRFSKKMTKKGLKKFYQKVKKGIDFCLNGKKGNKADNGNGWLQW